VCSSVSGIVVYWAAYLHLSALCFVVDTVGRALEALLTSGPLPITLKPILAKGIARRHASLSLAVCHTLVFLSRHSSHAFIRLVGGIGALGGGDRKPGGVGNKAANGRREGLEAMHKSHCRYLALFCYAHSRVSIRVRRFVMT
jgi:hypothetical protein